MSCVLGLDTSNYTTSAAVFSDDAAKNSSRLLDVPAGALGLRQSDALFSHVKRLPEIFGQLFEGGQQRIDAVGASTRPRSVEGSYMPCFLAGESLGRSLAQTLGVPFFAVSHQEGHIAAAAWSSGHMELLERPFLSWHLSGGTTELLYVRPEGVSVRVERIGGTSDISAGQIVDRTGRLLGLGFPSGKALDALCDKAEAATPFAVKLKGLEFSLSGLENKINDLHGSGASDGQVACFALSSVCSVVKRATAEAKKLYPDAGVLFSGGVASNSMLRREMSEMGAIFAAPEYSTDNAMGVALLTERLLKNEQSI